MNSPLKYVYLEQFDLLDEANRKMVLDYLLKEGFQVVVEVVGDKPVAGNSILLKDCQVVKDETEQIL